MADCVTSKNSLSQSLEKRSPITAPSPGSVKLAVILSAICDIIGEYEDKRFNSGQLNDNLKKVHPAFNHNDFGYLKFHKFCEGVDFNVKLLRGHP